jgi:hypothetical protein
MSKDLVMNESTKKVAVAFANSTWDRREVVYARENILDAMPIGIPLTCTEIAEKVRELGVASFYNCGGTLRVSVGRVAQCMKSLIPFGIVEKRIEKLDTPYSFNVSKTIYNYETRCWERVERIVTRDTVTKYVRVV